jgi:hypothetical protein
VTDDNDDDDELDVNPIAKVVDGTGVPLPLPPLLPLPLVVVNGAGIMIG